MDDWSQGAPLVVHGYPDGAAHPSRPGESEDASTGRSKPGRRLDHAAAMAAGRPSLASPSTSSTLSGESASVSFFSMILAILMIVLFLIDDRAVRSHRNNQVLLQHEETMNISVILFSFRACTSR